MKHDIHLKQRGSMQDFPPNGDISLKEFEVPLDDRIKGLKHRLRVEAAVVEGAKNAIKLLQTSNREKSDKKALSEVMLLLILFLDLSCIGVEHNMCHLLC